MADYSKSTNFTAKDALASGNPNKVIKGSEFDTEYSAVATAVATKYDDTDVATNAEADALTSDTKLITPVKIKRALENGVYDPISHFTTESGVDGAADFLLVHDGSAGAVRKVLVDNAVAGASGAVLTTRRVDGGTGLDGGGDLSADRTLSLNISSLLNNTPESSDELVFADASAGDSRKATIATTVRLITASETATGVVEIATIAEVAAGTDTSRAVTAAGVASAVAGNLPIYRSVVAVSGSTTLDATHLGNLVTVTANSVDLTIPQDTGATAFPIGSQLDVLLTTGTVAHELDIVAGTDITIRTPAGNTGSGAGKVTIGGGGGASLVRISTTVWHVVGQITAVTSS